MVGSIYGGWFSPTEASAVGAFCVGLLAAVLGGMRWRGFCVSDAARLVLLVAFPGLCLWLTGVQ